LICIKLLFFVYCLDVVIPERTDRVACPRAAAGAAAQVSESMLTAVTPTLIANLLPRDRHRGTHVNRIHQWAHATQLGTTPLREAG
jgi:hypothetical protein